MVSITVAIAAISYVYFTGLGVSTEEDMTTLAMNIYYKDNDANEIVWLISGLEGAALEEKDYHSSLLYKNGTKDTGASIELQDVTTQGYVNEGDTFLVKASIDGYFVFLITDTTSGDTIYRSSLTQY